MDSLSIRDSFIKSTTDAQRSHADGLECGN